MASWWGGGSPWGIENARAPAKKRGDLGLQHRALQLQSQWQEVSEQENRARVRNWQLLQDFQRAQDTLKDLAARTAAMATIRAEYGRQLEQRFPHWQQKLEEKRTVVQNKEQVELRLKEALRKTEEGSRREAHNRNAKGAHAPLTPPGPSLPTPPILAHGRPSPECGDTHFHSMKNTRVAKEDYAQNYTHTPWNPSTHPSWLTGVHSMSDVLQASDIQDFHSPAADLRGFQGLHRAGYPFLHNLRPLVSRPFDPRLLPLQGQPHQVPIMGCPPFWPVLYGGLPPRLQSPYSQVPCSGFPTTDSRDWGIAVAPEPHIEGDSPTKRGDRKDSDESPKDRDRGQQRRRRQQRASDQSYELDIKPVRLSSVHGDSSESSSICSLASRGGTAGERRRRRERKGGIQQSRMDREEGTSQKSSTGSNVRSLASNGVVRATDASGAPEEAIQRSGMPSAKALSTGEEENCSQEEASGVKAEVGINQDIEEGVETQDSSQRDGGITGDDEEGREKNRGGGMKEEGEEEVEKTVAEEEEEGEEEEMREESDVEEDAQKGEEGSGDEWSVEGGESPCSEVEGTGGVLEQAKEEEVGEEVLHSERHRYSEEEEGTEGELDEGGDGFEGEEEGESEVEVGEEEQEDVSQEEKGEDEWGGSDSSEEGEIEEGEVDGEMCDEGKCKAVEEDEDDDEGEEGTGEEGTVAADNSKEESEGTTDSEDEIITSQLSKRKYIVKKADLGMRSIPGPGKNMDDIEEEEEYEDEANDYEDEEDDDDGEDIEALLAPKKDPLKHQISDGDEEEGPDPATTLDEEPKNRALWQESTSGLEDEAPGSANLTTPREDHLEDFDDFYD